MDIEKLQKVQRARDLARWFREQVRNGTDGAPGDLMAATALALEHEAFRCEREAAGRTRSRRPRLVAARAA